MVRYGTQNIAISIYYTAYIHTTGLSDVTVTVIDLSDGSEELVSTTMTEVGTTGIYAYDHIFTTTGNFMVKCNSTTVPKLSEEVYEIIVGHVQPTIPIGDAYISISLFRTITGISENEADDTAVQNAIYYYIPFINRHTRKTTADPWTVSDDEYELVQVANCYGVAHRLVIQGWNLPPIEQTNANEISSQWLTDYRRTVYDITGRDPYPGMGNIGETGEGSGGVYEASIQTVTPDKASYIQSTTR